MPIGWISSRPEADSDLRAALPAGTLRRFAWTASRVVFEADHRPARRILAHGADLDGVVVAGLSLSELESLHVLRAWQILEGAGRLDVPAVVLVAPGADTRLLPGFARRMRAGWPFGSALFVADAPTVALLRSEGLVALERSEARTRGVAALLARRNGAVPAPPAHPIVAVQVQPPWRYGGSHTVFANQLDALHDRGWFVIRIFVDSDAGSGPTLRRRMAPVLADGTSDAAPHLEAVACAPGAPETHGSDQGDRYLLRELRSRTWATITDDALVARLAARAEIAVVNYIVHMGFALKACPAARLVLETHDDLTRNALTRSRLVGGPATFPTLGPLRRHAALERLIWRTADVCIALSLSELPRIRRHAPTAYVLPRPYARRALPADGEVLWDILVVMNAHHFNIPALDAFLEHVIAADPALAVRRVAIVGRIDTVLAPAWRDRLPQTQWLGYVADIDALRDRARLSVCPDLAGTGVAIKTLTAIAAGHPLVATSVALRGLAPAILDLLPPADTVVAMRRQIAALLDDPQALAARRAAVARARDLLWPAAGHGPALDAARAATRDAAPARARLAAALAEAPAPTEADDAGAETITIRFGAGGNDRPRLGTGWLHDEPGGRWSDGGTAILRLPAAWFAAPRWLALSVMEDFRGAAVGLTHDGVPLRALAAGPGLVWLALDRARPGADGLVELALVCPETLCPREAGLNHDERVLGVHVRTLEIVAPYSRVLPATAAEDAGVGRPPLRRRMAAIARKAADHARAMLAPR